MEVNVKERKAEMKRASGVRVFLALALVSPYLIVFILFTLIPVICGFCVFVYEVQPVSAGTKQIVGLKIISIFSSSIYLYRKRFGNRFPRCWFLT